MLLTLTLFGAVSLAEANSSGKIDLTKRADDIGDKRVPLQTIDLQKNHRFTDQRFPVKEWHGEYNALGRRRSSIEVKETRGKNMIRPEVVEMERVDRRMAPQNRRMAPMRNIDRVQEKQLVPKYRDAEVATVQGMARPDPSAKKKDEPLTMRDLNRFSFQRNHADTGGPKVDKAATPADKK